MSLYVTLLNTVQSITWLGQQAQGQNLNNFDRGHIEFVIYQKLNQLALWLQTLWPCDTKAQFCGLNRIKCSKHA